MIIAILEDKKGFRKAITLSEPTRDLRIPLPFIPEIYTKPTDVVDVPLSNMETLKFECYKELEPGKVYLFKEKK